MKVGVITSWPPEISGLSDYSKQLYETLASLAPKIKIYAHTPSKLQKANTSYKQGNSLEVKYAWTNKDPLYPFKLLKAIIRDNVEIVHVQHEYWLYGRGLKALLLPVLLALLRLMRKTVVITLHGLLVLTQLDKDFKKFHKFNVPLYLLKIFSIVYVRILSILSNIVIVHLNVMKEILKYQYGVNAEKVHVIPHGILGMRTDSILNDINREEKVVFTTFGSIRPDKGIENILKAFSKLAKIYDNVKLIIAGQYNPSMSPEASGYLNVIQNAIRRLNLEKHVMLKLNLPYEEVCNIYRKSYAVILNYLDKSVIAASGPLALAFAFAKPVIASKIPRFLEYRNFMLLVDPENIDKLAKYMGELIENKNLYSSLTRKLEALRNTYSWQNIAKEHLDMYVKLVRCPTTLHY